MRNKLTKHDEKRLTNFLRKHRKDNALSLLQTKGFLFCVVCCPDLVQPSEWIPLVLEETEFGDDREVEPIMNALMALYNQTNSQVVHGMAKLPKECRVLPQVMNNFADPAPLHQWSQGFMKGYSWLNESWEALLEGDDEAQYAFGTNLMVLGIAADRKAFENAFAEEMDEGERLQLAEKMLATLPNTIKAFAELALSLRAPMPFDLGQSSTMH